MEVLAPLGTAPPINSIGLPHRLLVFSIVKAQNANTENGNLDATTPEVSLHGKVNKTPFYYITFTIKVLNK